MGLTYHSLLEYIWVVVFTYIVLIEKHKEMRYYQNRWLALLQMFQLLPVHIYKVHH